MTKVMIVDDEKYVRTGVKNGTDWSLINCEVVGEASNGVEGLELAKELKPDLVISDIKMPKKTGIEMAEELIEKYPDTKVIFLTAYDDFEYARAAIRIGVSDYLLKPFEDGDWNLLRIIIVTMISIFQIWQKSLVLVKGI